MLLSVEVLNSVFPSRTVSLSRGAVLIEVLLSVEDSFSVEQLLVVEVLLSAKVLFFIEPLLSVGVLHSEEVSF